MLMDLGPQVYQEDFERQFLERAAEFYQARTVTLNLLPPPPHGGKGGGCRPSDALHTQSDCCNPVPEDLHFWRPLPSSSMLGAGLHGNEADDGLEYCLSWGRSQPDQQGSHIKGRNSEMDEG